MPSIQYQGRTLELNEQGFLARPRDWNEDVARVLAAVTVGIPLLSEQHWQVIHCIRAHYLARGKAPLVRALCRETNLTLKHVYQLFPGGPAEGACRVAGLPRADGCV